MQATGEHAAGNSDGGGRPSGDHRRMGEDIGQPRRRDPWMETPDYGRSDDLFSIEVNHGGFFCGLGMNRVYLDTKVDLFDDISRRSFCCASLGYILKELGYSIADLNIRVYWCKPGKTIGDGLVAIKQEKDADMMKNCVVEEKKLIMYVDHVNLLEKQRWDDVNQQHVPLPDVMSPPKQGYEHISEVDDVGNGDEKDVVMSCCSASSSDLDSDFADSDYEFEEDDEHFKKNVDEGVKDDLMEKTTSKSMREPEKYIGEEDELELPEDHKGEITYKWKMFNKLTDMQNPTFKTGMIFSNVQELRAAISMYCVRNRRKLKKVRNNAIRVEVVCQPKCPWKLIATKQTRTEGSFAVTKLNDVHTCERVWEVKELTAPLIAQEYLEEIRDNENLSLKSFAKNLEHHTIQKKHLLTFPLEEEEGQNGCCGERVKLLLMWTLTHPRHHHWMFLKPDH